MDFGVIVDLETTGLFADRDRIIEVGILEFAVEEGKEPIITETYSGLEDPGMPLSDVVMKLTGLNDDVLRGRTVDWQRVRTMLERASVVVAHNAEFDRSFLERRPELSGLKCHWGCSARHIRWQDHGFGTRALNYLAADHGFINPFAHRALFDCATTFRIIRPYLSELVFTSYEREFVMSADGAPFETKDLLRARGYRWDVERRVWRKTVFESDLAKEREFLQRDVYKGTARHSEEVILRSGAPVAKVKDAEAAEVVS
jgi:DNA polymerase III subunit epsilon